MCLCAGYDSRSCVIVACRCKRLRSFGVIYKEIFVEVNPVIDAIYQRRSIRAFEKRPISREDLKLIVSCGQWAPSAMDLQEWTFVVLDNTKRIDHLCGVVGAALGRASFNMYHPQAIVLVAHAKGGVGIDTDDGCAMQNMMLAAHSLGIGSVWISQLHDLCDVPEVRSELDALGVPATSDVRAICALGYPKDINDAKPSARSSQILWVE